MAYLGSRNHREPLILRPLPGRQRSRTAGWSLRFAVFAPILALVSLLAHHLGMVDTPTFLVLAGCVAAIALTGLVLIFVAGRSLWLKGSKGGHQVIGALFFTILTLAPFTVAATAFFANPYQNDVSTDLVDPPLLAEETRLSAADPMAIVAGHLKDGYPELSGRRYKAPPEAIEKTILGVAEARGWKLVSRRGRIGADDELFFEFVLLDSGARHAGIGYPAARRRGRHVLRGHAGAHAFRAARSRLECPVDRTISEDARFRADRYRRGLGRHEHAVDGRRPVGLHQSA
jgi:hypothetical protein